MAMTDIRRLSAAGVLAAALAAGVLTSIGAPADLSATGRCLAWFGSRDDGQCMGYSNGSPTYIGTPNMGVWGPDGITTGPLVPGTTFNQGLSP